MKLFTNNVNITNIFRYCLLKVEFGFTKVNRRFWDIDINGLFLLEISHDLLILKHTKLATIKISTSSLLFTRKKIYFGFFLQCHYVFMLRYLTGQILVPILLHHKNSHGPYSACSNIWGFWFVASISSQIIVSTSSFVIFFTLFSSCFLLVHFYFPGAHVMFRAFIPLIKHCSHCE